MAGAMTYALIQTVQISNRLTYGLLLDKIHETLEQVNNAKLFGSRLLHKLFHRRIIQVGFPLILQNFFVFFFFGKLY
jgi:hypothetical protein